MLAMHPYGFGQHQQNQILFAEPASEASLVRTCNVKKQNAKVSQELSAIQLSLMT
jgi:hypothetical protein